MSRDFNGSTVCRTARKRDGRREGGKKGEKEGGREEGRKGRRKEGREGGREGGREVPFRWMALARETQAGRSMHSCKAGRMCEGGYPEDRPLYGIPPAFSPSLPS